MDVIDYRTLRNAFRRLILENRLTPDQEKGTGLITEDQFAFEHRDFDSKKQEMYVEESTEILDESKSYGGDSTALEVSFSYNVINRQLKNNYIEDVENLRVAFFERFKLLRPFKIGDERYYVIECSRQKSIIDEGLSYSLINITMKINKN